MPLITDLAYKIDDQNTYDLEVTADGDLATSGGYQSWVVASLFSDRRAFPDEGIHDPLRRRGWHGSEIAGGDGHNFGSGIWFYHQARLRRDTVNGVRAEIEAALSWMIDEDLIETAVAEVTAEPAGRTLRILVDMHTPDHKRNLFQCAIATATELEIIEEQYSVIVG